MLYYQDFECLTLELKYEWHKSSVTSIQGENFKYKIIWNILNEQCTVTIDYADGVVEEWWKWQEYSEYPLNRCLTV